MKGRFLFFIIRVCPSFVLRGTGFSKRKMKSTTVTTTRHATTTTTSNTITRTQLQYDSNTKKSSKNNRYNNEKNKQRSRGARTAIPKYAFHKKRCSSNEACNEGTNKSNNFNNNKEELLCVTLISVFAHLPSLKTILSLHTITSNACQIFPRRKLL